MAKEYKIPEKSIDDISLLEPEATYSYADYLRWSFEERVELIKGKIFRMSPAPNRGHQRISVNLVSEIHVFLKDKTCTVYAAPFDVRIPKTPNDPDSKVYTVVQPDICVICDESKLDDAGGIGAPDLIVEILSPSTAAKDLRNKYELYQESRVKEYWIIYPNDAIVEIFVMDKNSLYDKPKKYIKGDVVTSTVLPRFEIEVDVIFQNV